MLKYYFKFALRNFTSNKVIFGGSLLTLCLGALCISLLFSYVYNELTMDDSLQHKDDIYVASIKQTPQSHPDVFDLKSYLKFDFTAHPELTSLSAVQRLPADYIKFSYDQKTFSVDGLGVDSTFLSIFDFPLLRGNHKTALHEPKNVLLTEKLAHKLFGNEDPMGKQIDVQQFEKEKFTVTGILKNPPANSSVQFDFLLTTYRQGSGRMGGTFILAGPDFEKEKFDQKIAQLTEGNERYKESEVKMIPFKEIYFNKGAIKDRGLFSSYGDQKSLQTILIIMLVILIISALNFSNLQIIYANKGVKANAIKRINGAGNRHISKQKIIEIVGLVLVVAVVNTVLYQLLLPKFNNLTQVFLDPPLGLVLLINVLVLVTIALFGMIYPLLVTARIPLIKGLSNQSFMASQLKGRRAIIVLQYTLTFILLISSIMVVKQLNMMLHKNMGFDTERIVSTQLIGQLPWEEREQAKNNYEVVKNRLTEDPAIVSFTQGYTPLEAMGMDWKVTEGDHKYDTQNSIFINLEYDKVLGLEMVEGRFFERGRDSSRAQQVIINEAAKKYWNITDISANTFWNKSWSGGDYGGGSYEIIGVVKDFNYEHLSSTPKPLIMLYFENMEDRFIVKFENGAEKTGLATVEALFKEQNPNEVFSYTFLKDEVAALYQKEKQLSINYVLFTLIALIISAIGLFTIALYDTQRRVKEIAVRKVNGATVKEVLIMLNKSIVKWIVVAFLIASPIAYLIMQKWLENFAYKAGMSWWIFAAAGGFTLVIALMTVSWRSYKAAMANPVESLRSE